MAYNTKFSVIEKVTHYRENQLAWREIASLPEYIPIPPGTLCTICKTGEIPHRWLKLLGLPPHGSVLVMTGDEIPPGTQVISASMCQCGQPFISNHPRRSKCFMCSPYRGKK